DTVPRFLKNGRYEPRPSVQTLANAMDVGNPSNWVRIMDLFDNDLATLKQTVSSQTFTDADTRDAIRTLYDRYHYVACPHTAIAWLAAEAYRKEHTGNFAAVFLSTAHPCKFPDVFSPEIADQITIPHQVEAMQGREKEVIGLGADYAGFKYYLLRSS